MTKKSGLADSPFFSMMQPQVKADPPVETPPPIAHPVKLDVPVSIDTPKPEREKEKVVVAVQEKKPAKPVKTPPEAASLEGIYEEVRKASQELGKEAATHRFTVAEKRHIAEIVYTYQTQGIKTTENEIARIALNYLIQDYKANGENSLIDKILKALHR